MLDVLRIFNPFMWADARARTLAGMGVGVGGLAARAYPGVLSLYLWVSHTHVSHVAVSPQNEYEWSQNPQ